MKDILLEDESTEKLIENIKVQTCFVTTMDRSAKLETKDPPTPPPSVKYYGTRTFEIPGTVRENAFEILWERDNDNLSVPTMILDAIIKVKEMLITNILLMFEKKKKTSFKPDGGGTRVDKRENVYKMFTETLNFLHFFHVSLSHILTLFHVFSHFPMIIHLFLHFSTIIHNYFIFSMDFHTLTFFFLLIQRKYSLKSRM